jgi:hypothetical protein
MPGAPAGQHAVIRVPPHGPGGRVATGRLRIDRRSFVRMDD